MYQKRKAYATMQHAYFVMKTRG